MSDPAIVPSPTSSVKRALQKVQLVREICAFIPVSDLPKVARVSHMWHDPATEVIWREVELGKFMELDEVLGTANTTPATAAQPSAACTSADYYMRSVRHITAREIALEAILPCARFLLARYHHARTMKGRDWEIDFAHRTITSTREVSVYQDGGVAALGRHGGIPGFKVIDNLTVRFDNCASRDRQARTSQPQRLLMDLISEYNICGRKTSTGITNYLAPIRILHYNQVEAADFPRWWADIPSWRSLERMSFTGAQTTFELSELEHLLGNTRLQSLSIQRAALPLSTLPDILAFLGEWLGGELALNIELELSLADVRTFRQAVTGTLEERPADLGEAYRSQIAKTHRRIDLQCGHRLQDGTTAPEHQRAEIQRHLQAIKCHFEWQFHTIKISFREAGSRSRTFSDIHPQWFGPGFGGAWGGNLGVDSVDNFGGW